MAATKYMVMYRMLNEATNLPVTNNASNEYKPNMEYYTDDHKMYAGNAVQQEEAYQEQQKMLIDAADVNNPKYEMFFSYEGTKKIRHRGVNGEEHTEDPYLIKDTYKRISGNPWFTNCVCGSLDAALEKAKKLVSMIGIENVKVIKMVAYDQFLKIK